MSTERTTRFERVLPGLFDELAETRTPAYLEAAIERASSGPQRPSWTFPGRWLPVDITTRIAPVARIPWRQLGVLALIGLLLAVALAVYVGSQQQRPAPPFGPAANGAIAFTSDGDIVVADRPGGDLRPLVAGPENDHGPWFSPDGTRLAFYRDTGLETFLMIADADGTNIVQISPASWYSGLSFAPDGESLVGLARIDGEPRVVIRPVDPAAALTVLDIRLPRTSEGLDHPTFRPTNPQEILVVAQPEPGDPSGAYPRGIYVYDVATGGIRTIVEPVYDGYVQDVEWVPDGEHITYSIGLVDHIVAADGSGDHVLDALLAVGDVLIDQRIDRLSPFSNDGTRIVIDVAEVDLPGDDSHQKSVVVPFDGEGEPVELACGLGMKVECAWSWIWSPDDSMLIGTVPHWTSSDRETSLPETYLQADPNTGQVTELDWVDVGGVGTSAWQRVAP